MNPFLDICFSSHLDFVFLFWIAGEAVINKLTLSSRKLEFSNLILYTTPPEVEAEVWFSGQNVTAELDKDKDSHLNLIDSSLITLIL